MLKTYASFSSFHFGDTQTNFFSFKFLKLKVLSSFDGETPKVGLYIYRYLIFTESILQTFFPQMLRQITRRTFTDV